jgi:hypothetical protein
VREQFWHPLYCTYVEEDEESKLALGLFCHIIEAAFLDYNLRRSAGLNFKKWVFLERYHIRIFPFFNRPYSICHSEDSGIVYRRALQHFFVGKTDPA